VNSLLRSNYTKTGQSILTIRLHFYRIIPTNGKQVANTYLEERVEKNKELIEYRIEQKKKNKD